MKGIILAGGKGTRLLPITRVTNKHLVPILNKPMVLYPIETLKALGITDILIVTGGDHIGGFAEFLGDGAEYGITLTYRVQKDAGGIAQALGLAKDFAQGQPVAVILGDNVYQNDVFRATPDTSRMAHVYTKHVADPNRFGVLVREDAGYRIVEKPKEFIGNEAVTGLYIYPADVFDIIPTLTPSARGELEITDVNNAYIAQNRLLPHDIGDAFWSDAGTPESLLAVTKWAYENTR